MLGSNEPDLLIVGPVEEEDRAAWRHILEHDAAEARHVSGCREALSFLHRNHVPVVICERDLPDGTWKDVLEPLAAQSHFPAVIVTSRLADERLWLEVLDAGGYDVLPKPLDRQEAKRTLVLARRHAIHSRRTARAGEQV